MPADKLLKIDVVIDVVCPWCYVGVKRMSKAVEIAKSKWPNLKVTMAYSPYQLDPDSPDGMDKQKVYQEKFGSAKIKMMQQRLIQVGKEEGIAFDFTGKMSNTLNSHRLINRVQKDQTSKTSLVVKSIMHRYFELSQDIGDLSVLVQAANDAGITDSEDLREFLASDRDTDIVKSRIDEVKQLGISGVPFFIINDKYGVSGAEVPESLVDAFERVLGSPDSSLPDDEE